MVRSQKCIQRPIALQAPLSMNDSQPCTNPNQPRTEAKTVTGSRAGSVKGFRAFTSSYSVWGLGSMMNGPDYELRPAGETNEQFTDTLNPPS